MTISLPRRSVRFRKDDAASDELVDDDDSIADPDMPPLVDRDDDSIIVHIEDDEDDPDIPALVERGREDNETAATVGGDVVAVSPVAATVAPQSECLSRPLFCFLCDFDRPP